MQFHSLTESEFLRFTETYRHRKAAEFLRDFHETSAPHRLSLYRRLERWLQLLPFDANDFEQLSNRYHLHLSKANVSWKEHNLLTNFQVSDHPSNAPCLPVNVYLDNLRSGYNVGSILRTTEAFRFSTVYFGGKTPQADNAKVQKTSMETYNKVTCIKDVDLS